MIILALDTSGPSLGVALRADGRTVFACVRQNGRTHSEGLMPLVDAALQTGGILPAQVDCFAAVAGPGSFTGVRIGVETVKALAHATENPCLGVNALEALAAGIPFFEGLVCALQDARAGQVYAAAYRDGVCAVPEEAAPLKDWLLRLPVAPRYCFVGDGALSHRDLIAEAMGKSAVFAPAERMCIDAAVVAGLAERSADRALPWQSLAPHYLRAPQAERERAAREAAHG